MERCIKNMFVNLYGVIDFLYLYFSPTCYYHLICVFFFFFFLDQHIHDIFKLSFKNISCKTFRHKILIEKSITSVFVQAITFPICISLIDLFIFTHVSLLLLYYSLVCKCVSLSYIILHILWYIKLTFKCPKVRY